MSKTTSRFAINLQRDFIASVQTQNIYLTLGYETLDGTYDLLSIGTTETDAELTKVTKPWAAKKLASTDLSPVAIRYNWSSGKYFKPYSASDANIYSGSSWNTSTISTCPHYCFNPNNNSVYVCTTRSSAIASTVEPVSTSVSSVQTAADGYVWQYLFTVPDSLAEKFLTTDRFPVPTVQTNPGTYSENYGQWVSQEFARTYFTDMAVTVNASELMLSTFLRSQVDSGSIGCVGIVSNPRENSGSSTVPATDVAYFNNSLGLVVPSGTTAFVAGNYLRDSASANNVAYIHSVEDSYPSASLKTVWISDRSGVWTSPTGISTYLANTNSTAVSQVIQPGLNIVPADVLYWSVPTSPFVHDTNDSLTEVRLTIDFQS